MCFCRNIRAAAAVVLAITLLWSVPCATWAAELEIFGAGATFPLPFYYKVFETYQRQFGTRIQYAGVGSGEGIKRVIGKTVDFGGTDVFMNEKEQKEAGAPVIHLPTCLGAVVLTYNLPNRPQLKFSPEIVADIFLGKIKIWNDARISALNEGISLPNLKIQPVHRSDASGTTNIFSDYLTKVNPEWREKIGRGKILKWPVGIEAPGNPGVAGLVKQMPGAIGYVELTYAYANNLAVSSLRNRAGNFILPDPHSASLAANSPQARDWTSLTDSDVPKAYPIAAFTWIVVYQDQKYRQRTRERGEELARILEWMIHEGQNHAASLSYAPLPEAAVRKCAALLKGMSYGGAPLSP